MARQKRTWTDEQLRDAVARSTTYRAVHRALGLTPGSQPNVKDRIIELELDTSHFDSHPKLRLATNDELRLLVARSHNLTQVLRGLGLGLRSHHFYKVKRRLTVLGIDTSHFKRKDQRRGRRASWTDDDLRAAVQSSFGYAQTIRALGLIPAGGNYDVIKRRIRELQLDTSHFRGQGWNVDGKHIKSVARPLAEVLVAGRFTTSHKLKKRLIAAGLLPGACQLCGWAERRASDGVIPIELDHINGDKLDNRIENLRVLCPNCHALQATHRGLNQARRRRQL